MCLAIWCPWAGPNSSVLRISMSSVPWSSSIRSEDSFAILLVDILPSNAIARVDDRPSVWLAQKAVCLAPPSRPRYDLGNRGYPREQTFRSRSRHLGPFDSQDPGLRAASWLGGQPAPEAGFRRCAPGQRWIAVSGAAQTGAGRLDHGGMEDERARTPGQVLLSDSHRAAAFGERDRRLGTSFQDDIVHRASQGGLTRYALAVDLYSSAEVALAFSAA